MAFLALNGAAVVSGLITLPRIGPWTADLVVAAPTLPDGFVTLTMAGTMTLHGAIYRGGQTRGATTARVVGGAGGLGTLLPPKGYHGVPLSLPLGEALTAAGERLSPTSDTTVLNTYLGAWSRLAMTAGGAIAALMHALPDAAWRVLPDGSVWVGVERWPASSLRDYTVTRDDPHHARQEIAATVPNVWPGETLGGRRVSTVEHRIEARSVRATVYFEE